MEVSHWDPHAGRERTMPHKLSSDIPMCAVAMAHVHVHTHTERERINK